MGYAVNVPAIRVLATDVTVNTTACVDVAATLVAAWLRYVAVKVWMPQVGLFLAKIVRVIISGVRVNVPPPAIGVDVTALVSLTYAVLVFVSVRVDVCVAVYVLYGGIVMVLVIAKRVLLGFMVALRVWDRVTVKVCVTVGLLVWFGVSTAVAIGLGGVVLL
jgi:hypothetical protein